MLTVLIFNLYTANHWNIQNLLFSAFALWVIVKQAAANKLTNDDTATNSLFWKQQWVSLFLIIIINELIMASTAH